MKKRLSIDRIGMRGSVGLLLLGSFLLILGIILQVSNLNLPDNALACTARITAFVPAEDGTRFSSPRTLVSYEINGEFYEDIALGQYEGNWKIGDTLDIYCNADDHTYIWTKAMQYRGWFYMVASTSFLLIGLYKMVQFRRIKGVNEDESDIDSTGEEKFQLSSAIIPLLAGLPLIVVGVTFGIVEKNSVLALILVILGGISCLTGILSLADFITFMNRERHKRREQKPGQGAEAP